MADLTTLSPMSDDSVPVGGPQSEKSTQKSAPAAASAADTLAEVNAFYAQGRSDRQPYEIQWFWNAAMIRGKQQTKWNPILNKLESKKIPSHRSNNSINRILPKVRARLAKFIKTRPYPQVIPANTDRSSVLDAKATEKVLDYQWRRLGLETKYEDAILWAQTTGKSFWWFRWNKDAIGRMQEPGPDMGGTGETHEIPLGDVEIELGTSFEVLVADAGVSRIADQPKIMRIKARYTSEVENRYKKPKGSIAGDANVSDLFQYQKQIADIGARNVTGFSLSDKSDVQGQAKGFSHVIVKEMFVRPCAMYPKGRYVVVAGDAVLKDEQELPFDFGPNASNPYPVVEFTDIVSAGQFWPTTMVEQLIGLQKEYNDLRNKMSEQQKLQLHPKLMIPKQANIRPNAYNSEAGEKIEYHFLPGMPPPTFLAPPNLSTDAWKVIDIIRNEFDDITSIYPSSVGAPGDNGESGFQTNLLQEAADSVHAPDIRRNELAVEEAMFKVRRFMALGYDVPRLISLVGKNHQPEVFEFSSDNIDEHAHIIVQAGSALPTLKAARAKMIMEMHTAALFGDPNDPATKRRVLGMLEVGGIEDATDQIRRDEDQARQENLDLSKSIALEEPQPWQNHTIHYETHRDLLNSPEIKMWSPEQRTEMVRHLILHVRFINPQNALMLAQQFGFQDLVVQIMPMVQPPPAQAGQPPAGPPPGGQAPPQGAQQPPPGPPQAQAA